MQKFQPGEVVARDRLGGIRPLEIIQPYHDRSCAIREALACSQNGKLFIVVDRGNGAFALWSIDTS